MSVDEQQVAIPITLPLLQLSQKAPILTSNCSKCTLLCKAHASATHLGLPLLHGKSDKSAIAEMPRLDSDRQAWQGMVLPPLSQTKQIARCEGNILNDLLCSPINKFPCATKQHRTANVSPLALKNVENNLLACWHDTTQKSKGHHSILLDRHKPARYCSLHFGQHAQAAKATIQKACL